MHDTVECLNCHISHPELQSPVATLIVIWIKFEHNYDHTQRFLGAEEVANNVMYMHMQEHKCSLVIDLMDCVGVSKYHSARACDCCVLADNRSHCWPKLLIAGN